LRVLKDVVADGVLHDLGLALDCAHFLEGAAAHGLDTETVMVVQLGGEPGLSSVVGQRLEIVAEVLIDLNLIDILDQVELLHAASANIGAPLDTQEQNKEEEHWGRRTVFVPREAVVVSWDWHGRVDNCRSLIVENLFVAHNPEAETEVNDRSPSHHAKGSVVEGWSIHRGLLIPVGNANLLNNVDINESERANREHHRQSETVHEGSVNGVHASGILEMHQVVRTSIFIDVLLDRMALGLVSLLASPEVLATFVQAAGQNHGESLNAEARVHVHRVDKHSPNKRIANVSVPVQVQIGH